MAERAPGSIEDNGYSAMVLADSISPRGHRLQTFVVRFPRFILAEINTHGRLAKNSASSRARPVAGVILDAIRDPVTPLFMGNNEPGMSASQELSHENQEKVLSIWRLNFEIDVLSTVAANGGLEKTLATIPDTTEKIKVTKRN